MTTEFSLADRGRRIAYLGVPYFGMAVARRAGARPGERPMVLLDEQGRVLAMDGRAARAGVAEGMDERGAFARCPDAVFDAAARYPILEAQESLWERVKRLIDRWQPAGLGSVYLDLAGVGGGLLEWCQALAGGIRQLGWTPALGATGSKFGASVAGQVAGRNTALLLRSEVQPVFLAAQPIGLLPLDADALVQLQHLGIRTLGQFARLPAAGVLARFGPAGRTAQRWAQGLDDRPVIPPWEMPEVSARIEFDTPLADRDRLLGILVRRSELLLEPLRRRFQAVGRILLIVTRTDGRVVPGRYVFPQPVVASGPVRAGLAVALERVPWDGQPAAEITLSFGDVCDVPARQLSLFDLAPMASADEASLASWSRSRLKETLDRLYTRFGEKAFRMATLTDPENLLPERRVSWHEFE